MTLGLEYWISVSHRRQPRRMAPCQALIRTTRIPQNPRTTSHAIVHIYSNEKVRLLLVFL